MSDLRARVAYLQGLVEGLAVDENGPQGRVLAELVDVLGDVAEALTEIQERQDHLNDYVEELDEDLTDLAGDVYLEMDEDPDADGEGGEDEELGELRCPQCGTTLALEAGDVGGREALSVVCPECRTMVGNVEKH